MTRNVPMTQCGARTRAGTPCARGAGWGTEHAGIGRCKLHGGRSPTHIAAARSAMAVRVAAEFGIRVEGDPEQVLLESVALASGYEQWLRLQLGNNPDPADPRVAQWEAALDMRSRLAARCVEKGIAMALVNAHERFAVIVVGLFNRVLPQLGVALTDDVIDVVTNELRAGGLAATS